MNLEGRNAYYNEEDNDIRVNEILQDDINDKEKFPSMICIVPGAGSNEYKFKVNWMKIGQKSGYL